MSARLTRRGAIAAFAGAAALGGLALTALGSGRARSAAAARLAGRGIVIATRFGRLEYAEAGAGPPLLMIHGTGGGFDQGLSFAAGLVRRGRRVIAPSRFGYLGSDFPDDPSPANQADALVALLDRLGIARLPVAGGSAGALSAVQLALRHPARCSGLILQVPAANVSGRDPVEMSALQEFLVRRVLNSDMLYWAALRATPDLLVANLLATDPVLLDMVPPGEQARAYRILEEIMPVSARARGMLNDAHFAGHPALVDFRRIRVPTLVISAEDDRFGTAATAREIAGVVRGARLVIYPSGGHILLGHDEDVSDEIHRFVAGLPA